MEEAKDYTALGDCYLKLAQLIGNYRLENRTTLTELENQTLKDLHWTLLNYADDFFTESAIVLVQEIRESLDKVVEITAKIKETTFKLTQIQNAINIATSAVTLAASFVTKNPQVIGDALTQLSSAVKIFRKKNA